MTKWRRERVKYGLGPMGDSDVPSSSSSDSEEDEDEEGNVKNTLFSVILFRTSTNERHEQEIRRCSSSAHDQISSPQDDQLWTLSFFNFWCVF